MGRGAEAAARYAEYLEKYPNGERIDTAHLNIIDAKRKEKGLPPVAATGKVALDPLGTEGFDVRQPQHIALAANLGLGVFDLKSPQGRRSAIDHRVVKVG